MIESETGQSTAYALDSLYDRGFFFVNPGEQIYEGQNRGRALQDNDITINLTKQKTVDQFSGL